MNVLTPNPSPRTDASTLTMSTDDVGRRVAPPAFQLDLVTSLKMHPVLASATTLGIFLLLLVYALTLKPVYEAETVLYEQPEAVKLLGESAASSFDSGRYDSFLQEQIQRIQRPDTITEALATLPRNTWAEYGASPEAATEGVLSKLKVARVTTSYQLALTLKGSDPRNITEVVNAIAQTYLHLVHKQAQSDIEERASILTQERLHVASELRRAQEEQSALSASLGVANPNGEGDPYEAELAALHEQLVQARGAHDAAAAQLSSLSAPGQRQGPALTAAADELILGDAGLASLKSSVNQRRATLRGQMAGMTPDNPLRQRNQEELAELDRSLEEMTSTLRAKAERDLQEKLRSDLQRTADLQGKIHLQLAQRTVAATSSTPKLQRAAELNTELKRLLLRQAEIDDAMRGLQLEASSPGAARLALPAQIPVAPEASRKRMVLLASFPVALLFGAFAAAIARKCDQTIYSASDVQNILGFPPMASLPVRSQLSNTVLEQDILRLAGSIETSCRTKGIRTFLFTAVSSRTDIKPLGGMVLERLRHMGVQADKVTTSALLLPSHSDQVSQSQADALRPADEQGFVNENLRLLLARHTLLLIEADPLVDSAETEYVARCANATILVAQYELTTRAELSRAADLLQRLHVPGVGVVLQGAWEHPVANEAIRSSNPLPNPTLATIDAFQRAHTEDLKAALTTARSEAHAPTVSTLSTNPVVPPAENTGAESTNGVNDHSPSVGSDALAFSTVDSTIPSPSAHSDNLTSASVAEPAVSRSDPPAGPFKVPENAAGKENPRAASVPPAAEASGNQLRPFLQQTSSDSRLRTAKVANAGNLQDPSDRKHVALEAQENLRTPKTDTASCDSVEKPRFRDPLPPAPSRRWDPIPPLRPSKLDSLHADAAHSPNPQPAFDNPLQLQTSRIAVDHLPHELAQQEGRLIRPWSLLSRFQQTSHSLPRARYTEPEEEVRSRTVHV